MTPKLISLFILILVNTTAGVIILAAMIMAMNGYSESDAIWGFGAFVVLAILVTTITSIGAMFVVGKLMKRAYGAAKAAIISTVVFSVLSIVLLFACSVVGVGVAEIVRVNF